MNTFLNQISVLSPLGYVGSSSGRKWGGSYWAVTSCDDFPQLSSSSGSPYVIMASTPIPARATPCSQLLVSFSFTAELPESLYHSAFTVLGTLCPCSVTCSARVLNVIGPVQSPLGDDKECHLCWWPVPLCGQAVEGVEWDRVTQLE